MNNNNNTGWGALEEDRIPVHAPTLRGLIQADKGMGCWQGHWKLFKRSYRYITVSRTAFVCRDTERRGGDWTQLNLVRGGRR